MSTRTAAMASAVWLALALLFGLGLLLAGDAAGAKAYFAGYLVEKSLSLDNVFVFLLVFGAFGIAAAERHRLLSYGVAVALVLRGVFIVLGAALLESFSWTSFVFAAILLVTAWKMWSHRHDHDSETELVERVRKRLPFAKPAVAALVAIVLVDLLFAVDSVPAILAITSDAYIVVAANAFALLGLRPLFFLVADLVERLYYLKAALAAVLAFVGVKLILGELVGKVGPEFSLPVIAAILAAGVAASLIRERRQSATPQEA
jgi:tellurite resistance protein TerC